MVSERPVKNYPGAPDDDELCGVNGCRRKTGGEPCWQHAAPKVTHREPPVTHRDPPPMRMRVGKALPEGEPLPTAYLRQRIACVSCRAITTADGSRAVLARAVTADGGVAYLRCVVCGHRFKLPVRTTM
jgi:hypothetical protein